MGDFNRGGSRPRGRGSPNRGGQGRGGHGGGFGGGGPRRFRGPGDMHDAVCCDCGKECKVPFKPTEGKEVRCSECHKKHMGY